MPKIDFGPAPPRSAIKKPRLSGAFLRAAEGTRTLDLLHGKRYCIGADEPQNAWETDQKHDGIRALKFG
jgi:hypothetical protein